MLMFFFSPFITGAPYKNEIYFVKSAYGLKENIFPLNAKLALTAK